MIDHYDEEIQWLYSNIKNIIENAVNKPPKEIEFLVFNWVKIKVMNDGKETTKTINLDDLLKLFAMCCEITRQHYRN